MATWLRLARGRETMTIPLNVPDYRNYQTFRAGAQYAKPVARLLRNAAPADLSADEKKALRTIEESAAQIQAIYAERDRVTKGRVRAVFDGFINYWSAMHEVLAGLARLDTQFGDVGERARALVGSYFPDAVSFVKLDAHAAWFEAQRRLDRMREEGQVEEIGALAGEPVFAAVRKGTAELGEAIGVGKTPRGELPSTTAMQEAVAKFSRAVGAYGRLLAAKVDEEDAASIERFRRAVAPMDEYRSMRSKGGAGEGEEPELPEEPSEPEVTPAPVVE